MVTTVVTTVWYAATVCEMRHDRYPMMYSAVYVPRDATAHLPGRGRIQSRSPGSPDWRERIALGILNDGWRRAVSEERRTEVLMGTGGTVTCACGSRGFLIVDVETGEQVDLKTYYATVRARSIDPTNLAAHDRADTSRLQMVCANPACRRVLGNA